MSPSKCDEKKSACIKDNGKHRYRYALWWKCSMPPTEEGYICWILLNPSKATEDKSDPTVSRVIRLSRWFGYNRCVVLNLIPYYETESEKLKAIDPAIARGNMALQDKKIVDAMRGADKIICAWGNADGLRNDLVNPMIEKLGKWVKEKKLAEKIYSLKITTKGNPHHPRGLGDKDITPQRYCVACRNKSSGCDGNVVKRANDTLDFVMPRCKRCNKKNCT